MVHAAVTLDCHSENNFNMDRVPIYIELRVIHSEIVKIMHIFQYKNVHSCMFFSLKIIHSTESLINFILLDNSMLF